MGMLAGSRARDEATGAVYDSMRSIISVRKVSGGGAHRPTRPPSLISLLAERTWKAAATSSALPSARVSATQIGLSGSRIELGQVRADLVASQRALQLEVGAKAVASIRRIIKCNSELVGLHHVGCVVVILHPANNLSPSLSAIAVVLSA